MLKSASNFKVGDRIHCFPSKIYGTIIYVSPEYGFFIGVLGLDGGEFEIMNNSSFLTHVSAEEFETAEVLNV